MTMATGLVTSKQLPPLSCTIAPSFQHLFMAIRLSGKVIITLALLAITVIFLAGSRGMIRAGTVRHFWSEGQYTIPGPSGRGTQGIRIHWHTGDDPTRTAGKVRYPHQKFRAACCQWFIRT